jgi:hypothetical protein
MDGIIIVGIIAAFAFFSPAADKKLTKAEKEKIHQEKLSRTPDQVLEKKDVVPNED